MIAKFYHIFLICIFLGPGTLYCQEGDNLSTTLEVEHRTYTTKKIVDAPKIDAQFDEACWDEVEWQSDFIVNQPNNGDVPKRQTKFKIIYDDNHLYLAFKCFHEDISKIESRLSRRDNFPGDWIEVNIGSFGDKNTAFSFTSSVSGVKGDEFITNNGNNWDDNWNPIWYHRTAIDSTGWTSEVKIPFSQLRFGNQEEQEWGIQIQRRDFGADERSSWQWIPRNASGWVSNFGTLKGIKGIKPKRQIEIQPYVLSSLNTYDADPNNPFADGSDTDFNFGLDGKVGITNDITLDFTINPDFGQVEADPSQLNLDGFQIFFSERRPFFIENNNLFDFQVTGSSAGGNYDADNLFYSRRIGASPQGGVRVVDEAFTNRPNFTSIIGSAKVSGKTKTGWSIGVMESITAEEKVTIDVGGTRTEEVIQPLSNNFVSRLSKDFNDGATTFGATMTFVNRKLGGTGLENQFHSDALSGGINLRHTWKEREWQIKGSLIFSEVKGTSEKITNTQQSFGHYFQRPDAEHLSVDTTLTSLGGNGGSLILANYWGEDNISVETGMTWRSTGLELNDLGFMNTADEINYFLWSAYRIPTSKGIFRSFQWNYNHWSRWTAGGEHLYLAVNTNAHASFTNYWNVSLGFNYEFKDISQKALFGGPLLRRAPGLYKFINVNSDSRKKFTFGFNVGGFDAVGSDAGSVIVKNINFWTSYQISNAFQISLNPSYFSQHRKIQNVGFQSLATEPRYITGTLDQKSLSLSIRASYSLTPNLTVEYWGQPFNSIGNYSDFKYITNPVAKEFTDRFYQYGDDEITYNAESDQYSVIERDNGYTYNINNPDFNFLQWRSNMVVRWEYKPGSELFLVWTQSSTNLTDPSQGIFTSLKDDLFAENTDNIFLLKATYRLY
ncbi:MAG: carbohydrate binding family 9 domain-containing protein [Saprospiraceae bacterium]|nr:carbohydrate binding family 9 domain-containing protein [Saprospiraceae bacterium]